MSILHINHARLVHTGKASTKFLLFALVHFTNSDTHLCWPTIQLLCEFTELNRKTVIAGLKELKNAGLIRPANQKSGISSRSVVYHFMPQQFKKSDFKKAEKVG